MGTCDRCGTRQAGLGLCDQCSQELTDAVMTALDQGDQ